jgi:hypothetical protein
LANFSERLEKIVKITLERPKKHNPRISQFFVEKLMAKGVGKKHYSPKALW